MIIQEALAFGRKRLTHSSSPTLDARLLLEFVLQKEHAFLVAHRDEALTAEQEQAYHLLIDAAARQEPIPYLTGRAPFFGRIFRVTPAVLIPRPETEQLVECALEWAKGRGRIKIVDVGTGSGCIAITLALALSEANIEAVDVSKGAILVAQQNAETHQAVQIHFHQGDLLEPINGRPDLIVANLPYITDKEWTALPNAVKSFEPTLALKGGRTGLDFIEQLLIQAQEKLAPEGAIFLEIGWKQGSAALELARSYFPTKQVNLLVDYAGNDRIITLR